MCTSPDGFEANKRARAALPFAAACMASALHEDTTLRDDVYLIHLHWVICIYIPVLYALLLRRVGLYTDGTSGHHRHSLRSIFSTSSALLSERVEISSSALIYYIDARCVMIIIIISA